MSNTEGQTDRVDQLVSALRDENEALRDHAVASLGQIGEEALSRLMALLEDEDVVIREAATSAIVRMGPVVVEPLIEALTDDEWSVREQAAAALGKLKDARGVEPLLKALKDRDGLYVLLRSGRWSDWKMHEQFLALWMRWVIRQFGKMPLAC